VCVCVLCIGRLVFGGWMSGVPRRRVQWRWEGRRGGFAGGSAARLGGRTPIIIIITGTGLYGFCHELTGTGPFSDPIIGHAIVFLCIMYIGRSNTTGVRIITMLLIIIILRYYYTCDVTRRILVTFLLQYNIILYYYVTPAGIRSSA